MQSSIRLGRLWNTAVYWHVSCIPVFILVVWTLDALVLPAWAPGLSLLEYWEVAIGTGLVFLLSVLLHTAAHVATARWLGLHVPAVTIYGCVGMLRGAQVGRTPGETARLALSGPWASMLLSLLFVWIWWRVADIAWLAPAALWLIGLNLGLALFNLLPVPPLAGWHVLRGVMWQLRGVPWRLPSYTVRFITEMVAAMLIGVGFVFFVLDNWPLAAWFAVLGLLLNLVGAFPDRTTSQAGA